MSLRLEPPASEADWQAFHDIREAVLWTARGRSGYDRHHPHDYEVAQNHPLVLKDGPRAVGTVRLDEHGDGIGCVRLVAITPDAQGGGHGRTMMTLCEDRARDLGIHTLVVNSAPDAVGFYRRLGWEPHGWDPTELIGIAEDCIQMRKRL